MDLDLLKGRVIVDVDRSDDDPCLVLDDGTRVYSTSGELDALSVEEQQQPVDHGPTLEWYYPVSASET